MVAEITYKYLMLKVRSLLVKRLTGVIMLSCSLSSALAKPDIDSFSQNEDLWVSVANVRVSPAKVQLFSSKTAGVVKFNKGSMSLLREGEAWAIDGPKRLRLSEESLELENKGIKNKLFDAALDYDDKVDALVKKQATLYDEIKKFDALSTDSEVKNEEGLKKKISEAKAKLKKELGRLDSRLEKLKSKSAYDLEIAQIKLDLKKRNMEFLNTKRNAEHVARFDGQLELNIELPLDVDFPYEIWVEGGQEIGTLTNDNHYNVILATMPPVMINLDPKSLYVVINKDSEKSEIKGRFDKVISNPGRVVSNKSMIFKVEDGGQATAKRLQGANLLAHVYTKLGKSCRIVPKSVLMEHFSDSAPEQNWAFLVNSLWPDYELLSVGRNDLAIAKLDEVMLQKK